MADKLILKILDGETVETPPIWLMRQAGRYLAEYREVRARAGSFVDLCLNPELAAEVTFQPIRRFGFDASILFSDILIVPLGLGRNLRFEEGVGPILDKLEDPNELPEFDEDKFHAVVGNVYETVARLKEGLPKEVGLIGFAGSPWTVASYVVEGGSSKDYAKLKTLAYRDPVGFQKLIDLLVEATVAYLDRQVLAGAEIIKLFDSWAGAAPVSIFETAVIGATKEIVSRLRAKHPALKIIGFARGAGALTERYAKETDVDAVALDSSMPFTLAKDLQKVLPVQGNLDPIALVAGGDALDAETDRMMEALAGGPYIANLGHGIVPQTPIPHVEQFINRVRGWRR